MNKIVLLPIVVVVFAGIFYFLLNPPKPEYFDENADVMYFYNDGCHVCNYIKPALEQLGNLGYRVKGINIQVDEIPQGIIITGTPTFIGPNGEKIVGINQGETVDHFKSRLQEFLDKYK